MDTVIINCFVIIGTSQISHSYFLWRFPFIDRALINHMHKDVTKHPVLIEVIQQVPDSCIL